MPGKRTHSEGSAVAPEVDNELEKGQEATALIPWAKWSDGLVAQKQVDLRSILEESAGVAINGLSLHYAARHAESFGVHKFNNGGLQVCITTPHGNIRPTSFVFQGFVTKNTSLVANSLKSNSGSFFQVIELNVLLLDEKNNLSFVMAAAAKYAAEKHIGFNRYNISPESFKLGRMYFPENGRVNEPGFKIKRVEKGVHANMAYIPVYDYTKREVDLKSITQIKMMDVPLKASDPPLLHRGDKVIIGASIGINSEQYGWRLMPNWVALVEKGVSGEMAESSGSASLPNASVSPYKKAKVNQDFVFVDDSAEFD